MLTGVVEVPLPTFCEDDCDPYEPVVPYSNVTLDDNPFGFTLAFNVAPGAHERRRTAHHAGGGGTGRERLVSAVEGPRLVHGDDLEVVGRVALQPGDRRRQRLSRGAVAGVLGSAVELP